jgi:hypothetical protein
MCTSMGINAILTSPIIPNFESRRLLIYYADLHGYLCILDHVWFIIPFWYRRPLVLDTVTEITVNFVGAKNCGLISALLSRAATGNFPARGTSRPSLIDTFLTLSLSVIAAHHHQPPCPFVYLIQTSSKAENKTGSNSTGTKAEAGRGPC